MSKIALGLTLAIGVLTIVPSASRTLRQSLEWTCPICHRKFQFDPRDPDHMRRWTSNHLSSHDSESVLPPPPPAVPAYLIDGYQQSRLRLDRVTSSRLPDFSRPNNLSDLHYALAELLKIAQDELDRLNSEASDLSRQLQNLTEEISSNKNRISEIASEIEGLRREISSLESSVNAGESKKAAQADLQEKLSQVATTMNEQAVSFMQSFYSRVREAQNRGLIPPPSSYRALPSPAPPRYEEPEARISSSLERRQSPVFQRPPEARLAPRAPDYREHLRAPLRAPLREVVSEAKVKNEIDRINELVPQLASARRDAEAGRKRLAQPERQVGEQRAEIERLGNQKESAESRKRSLSDAAGKIESDLWDLASKVADLARDATRKWVVYSFWKHADKYARDLLLDSGAEHSAAWFGTFRKVMTHTVEFGSDVFTVIGKTPDAAFTDEWGALEAELNQAVEKFKLNLFLDYTELPKWLQKLMPKGSKPWRNAD